MKRDELEHVIRAAGANADTTDLVLIGSQAIFGSVEAPPEELSESIEADIFPKDSPEKAILIDSAIGEQSVFHKIFGYYAHGVGKETAILPDGAWDRLVPLRNENTRGITAWCLEIHNVAVSKLCAGRGKRHHVVEAMLEHDLVKAQTVRDRAGTVANKEVGRLAAERFERLNKDREKKRKEKDPSV